MLRAVTIALDVQTIDETLPAKLLGGAPLIPGATRSIPGGVMVFQAACLSDIPGEASVFRFSIQLGSANAAALVANWLFSQLRDTAVALIVSGRPTPVSHHDLITAFRRAA